MSVKRFLSFAALSLSLVISAAAQDRPIGHWRSHLPYSNAISVATDGVSLYAVSTESFYSYNTASQELNAYSKVEGMADVGMSYIGYDAVTGFVILGYQNSNIDLFRDETFYNIPDIKLKNINGSKTINHIFTDNGMAYISTGFGVVVLNLTKRETKETYSFIENNQVQEVRCFTALGSYFYAVTSNGIYKADRNNPNLQAFTAWQRLDSRTDLVSAAASAANVFVHNDDSLFKVTNNVLQFIYRTDTTSRITHIDPAGNGLWINEYPDSIYIGWVKLMNPSLQVVDSFRAGVPGKPVQTVETVSGEVWFADEINSLAKREPDRIGWFRPEGPAGITSFDILPYNGDVWVAHGSYGDTWAYTYNTKGFSHLTGDRWKPYNRSTYSIFQDTLTDFIVFARDPADGTLYAGSYRGGLFVLRTDGSYELIKKGSMLQPTVGDPTAYRISGLSFDQKGDLWITQAAAPNELVVKTHDGSWYRYQGPAGSFISAYITTDDYNQKWYLLANGGGVAVYNDNNTPETGSDDSYARLNEGNGLPSNNTNAIVKDRSGAIWIGTNNGIGIVNCPDLVIQGDCQVEKRIVQFDQFAGYLFQNERVRTIAVDGANRKWVGTSNGVWLLSPEGDKIISRFTAENSPLPSNRVQKIAVDPVTGDVYMGTELGLVSFRGTATDGGETNTDVTTFPNPVPSGYAGSIAIRGLTENADVRITDISGQLVFRTKALGGQAVWNGMDYKGRRPQSGVYLIFVTNKDGSQTHAGKMVFME